MAIGLSLEDITSMLLAADKIRNTVNLPVRAENGLTINQSSTNMLNEVMNIISEFVPDDRKQGFKAAMNDCNRYCGSYCSLKSHIRGIKGENPNIYHLLNAVKSIVPMVGSNGQYSLGKMINIIEAITK